MCDPQRMQQRRPATCACTPLLAALLLLCTCATAVTIIEPKTQYSRNVSKGIGPGQNIFLQLLSLTNASDPSQLYPEQVKLTPWASGSMLVSWSTRTPQLQLLTNCTRQPSDPDPDPYPTANVTFLQIGTRPGRYRSTLPGQALVYNVTADPNPNLNISQDIKAIFYSSGVIHHVLASGLHPGRTYHYRVGDGQHWSPEYHFTALGSSRQQWPLRIGALGDTGTSRETYANLAIQQELQPDILLHLGDITYADRFNLPTAWDAFFRMGSAAAGLPLFPFIPSLFTPGNHEIESPACYRHASLGAFPYFKAYNARLPAPYPRPRQNASAESGQAPQPISTHPATNTPGAAAANQFYSVDLPGAHLVFLSSYVHGDQLTPETPQFQWLEQDLAQVNRSETPWLIVSIHEAWYTSLSGHFKENECMRKAYEPLLAAHQVDIYFHGHVHAYERTRPVSNYSLSRQGAVHITVGNGGTLEPELLQYIDAVCPSSGFPALQLQQPQFHPWLPSSCMASYQYTVNGTNCAFSGVQPPACSQCYSAQPAWSAHREPDYGTGMLTIVNETTAVWEYFRLSDNMPDLDGQPPDRANLTVRDWAWIVRQQQHGQEP